MTQRYMLDTNVVSHIMQGRDAALLRSGGRGWVPSEDELRSWP